MDRRLFMRGLSIVCQRKRLVKNLWMDESENVT